MPPLRKLNLGHRSKIKNWGIFRGTKFVYRTTRGPNGITGFRAMKRGRPSWKGLKKRLGGPDIERPVAYYNLLGRPIKK